MSKGLSEMCPLGEKMAKIWLKLQENGEKKSQMAKEKYILARNPDIQTISWNSNISKGTPMFIPDVKGHMELRTSFI